jgi:hypothetical protein
MTPAGDRVAQGRDALRALPARQTILDAIRRRHPGRRRHDRDPGAQRWIALPSFSTR